MTEATQNEAKCYSCGHRWTPKPATIVSRCSVCGSRKVAEVAKVARTGGAA